MESKRFCVICLSDKTYVTKKGKPQWYKHGDFDYCNKCQNKLVSNPKRPNRNYPKNNDKVFKFKNKTMFSNQPVRKGICSQCGRKKGDKYIIWGEEKIVKTHLHHIEYHDDNPLKSTIELCASCHMITTWDNGGKLGRPKK